MTRARAGRDGARQLRRLLRPHLGRLGVSVAAALSGMVLAGLSPVVVQRGVDETVGGHSGRVTGWVAVLLAVGTLRAVLTLVRRWYGGRVAIEVEAQLRRSVHDHLLVLDVSTADELVSGDVFSRVNGDVTQIGQLLASLGVILGSLAYVGISLVVMVSYSLPLSGVVLLALPALVLISRWTSPQLFAANWEAQTRRSAMVASADEALAGVRLVKGFDQEAREVARFEARARDFFGSRARSLRLEARFSATLQAVPGIGLTAVLALGAHLAMAGEVSTGTLLAFATYLLQLVATVRLLANGVTVAQAAGAGAAHVGQLLDLAPVVAEHSGALPLPPGPGRVRFDDVTFGYDPGRPVLRRLSLDVAPGHTVALVGASGSGKSTVALLLARLRDPDGGRVLVNGVDVAAVTLGSLRKQVTVAFEDPFLFSGSITENIAFGSPGATPDEVRAAAERAGVRGFIATLPDEFDTMVGEGGIALSGGQRQRIGLARALLRSSPVLFLDDPTGAVDPCTEAEIVAALRPALAGRTVILVARRPATLSLADCVAVIEGGRIVDQGTHEELLRRSPRYRELVFGFSPGMDEDPEAPAVLPRQAVGRAEAGVGLPSEGRWVRPTAPPASGGSRRLREMADDPGPGTMASVGAGEGVRLRPALLAHRRLFAAAAALLLLDSLLPLAVPVVLKVGIDRGILAPSAFVIGLAAVALLVVTAAGAVVAWHGAVQSGLVAERVLFGLRTAIFAHLQRLGLSFYEQNPSGSVLSRLTTDVDSLGLFLRGAATLLVSLVRLVGMAVVLMVLDARLAVTALMCVPVLMLFTTRFRRASDGAYAIERECIGAVNATLQEAFRGLPVTWAYGEEEHWRQRFAGAVECHRRAQLAGQRASCAYFPLVEFTGVAATSAVLALGARLVAGATLTPGELVAFILYLTQLFAPVQQLGSVFDAYQQARAARRRLDRLLAEPPDPGQPELSRDGLAPVEPTPADSSGSDVVLSGVSFTYPGADREALHAVDLVIRAGETLALVGETGAGKSTLLKLLARFYDPTAGTISVGGEDLRQLPGWRRRVGVVPQEATVLARTVRENIAYGRPGATDAEVLVAARFVGADAFVESLPADYDTPVAGGRSLAAGERQLLALARVYLSDRRIVLLDEATASLDPATEARVQRALGRVSAGRTMVLVAHRLSTARWADRIAVLSQGHLVETGTHEELRARGGHYARLWGVWQGPSELWGADALPLLPEITYGASDPHSRHDRDAAELGRTSGGR